MEKVTKKTENVIAAESPEAFVLVLNGWSTAITHFHFVAAIASYPVGYQRGFKTALLAFSPMISETKFTAEEQKSLSKLFL